MHFEECFMVVVLPSLYHLLGPISSKADDFGVRSSCLAVRMLGCACLRGLLHGGKVGSTSACLVVNPGAHRVAE